MNNYKKEYLDALDKNQKLREEIHDKNRIIETYEILLNKDVMKSIETSLKEFKEGKGIPLSELDANHRKDAEVKE